MKKNFIKLVLSVFVFVSTISISTPALALTAGDIAMLQSAGIITAAQAATLMAGIAPAGSTLPIITDTEIISNTSTCVDLKNYLSYGAKDANKNGEVTILQDFLQSEGYLTTNPTGFYGLMTVKAVKAFQAANGITQAGYVGVGTRAKIKEITCGTNAAIIPTTTPTIVNNVPVLNTSASINGYNVLVGNSIEMTGSNFMCKPQGIGAQFIQNGNIVSQSSSNLCDVNLARFIVPNIPTGSYQVKIINDSFSAPNVSSGYITLNITNAIVTPVIGTDLKISMSATSPTGNINPGTSVTLAKYVLQNTTNTPAVVSNLAIAISSTATNISNLYLMANGIQVSSPIQPQILSVGNNLGLNNISANITIPANTSIELSVKGDLSPSVNQSFFVSLNGATANIPIVAVYPLYKGTLIIQSTTATTTSGYGYSATSCTTQGTILVGGTIGCDIIANGTIDTSNSYCVSKSGKQDTLKKDVFNRTNRYYGTLYGLNVGDQVDVYIKGATNSIQCTPSLNTPVVQTSPSVKINGTPTLSLAYNSSNKESLLTATFNVTLSSGSSDINLYKYFSGTLLNTTTNYTGYNNSMVTDVVFPSTSNVLNDTFGRPYIVVPANTQINLTLTITSNPQNMFAGNYVAGISNLYSINTNAATTASGVLTQIWAPSTKTNSQVIVGEVSPYINSVTAVASSSGIVIIVNGSRLQNSTQTNWTSNVTSLTNSTNNISFITTIADGTYPLQVTDSTTGASNIVNVQVVNQTPTIVPSLIIGKNAAFANSNTQTNMTNVKIGSYVVAAGSSEGINIAGLSISLAGSVNSLSNLYASYDGTVTNVIQPSTGNNVIGTNLILGAAMNKVIDIYADISSTFMTITTSLSATGLGMTSGTGVSTPGQTGQTINVLTATSSYTATSCTTQGTILVGGNIGCDVVTNGTINLSGSYCVSNSGKQAVLKADALGRANRYYATLTGLTAGDKVNVYINGATNGILCTPSLNASAKNVNVATVLEALSIDDLITVIKLLTGQK